MSEQVPGDSTALEPKTGKVHDLRPEAAGLVDICKLAADRLRSLDRVQYETTVCSVRDTSLGISELRFMHNPEETGELRVSVSITSTPRKLPMFTISQLNYTFTRTTEVCLDGDNEPSVGVVNEVTESGDGDGYSYTVGEKVFKADRFKDIDERTRGDIERITKALGQVLPEDVDPSRNW